MDTKQKYDAERKMLFPRQRIMVFIGWVVLMSQIESDLTPVAHLCL